MESAYGAAAAITAQGRIPAVKLTAKQTPEKINRQDKTGSRTFVGLPTGLRKTTTFDLRSYMSAWAADAAAPAHDPLFQAVTGGPSSSLGWRDHQLWQLAGARWPLQRRTGWRLE